jgi:hypothetical protein
MPCTLTRSAQMWRPHRRAAARRADTPCCGQTQVGGVLYNKHIRSCSGTAPSGAAAGHTSSSARHLRPHMQLSRPASRQAQRGTPLCMPLGLASPVASLCCALNVCCCCCCCCPFPRSPLPGVCAHRLPGQQQHGGMHPAAHRVTAGGRQAAGGPGGQPEPRGTGRSHCCARVCGW